LVLQKKVVPLPHRNKLLKPHDVKVNRLNKMELIKNRYEKRRGASRIESMSFFLKVVLQYFEERPVVSNKCLKSYREFCRHLNKAIEKAEYACAKPARIGNSTSFGFTLTGQSHAFNTERIIQAMKQLHDAGFSTWASVEPIVDFESAFDMIRKSIPFCDHYEIGLLSGKKYDKEKLRDFVRAIVFNNNNTPEFMGSDATFYFKDSLLSAAGIDRKNLPENCVEAFQ
jgi:hypothetical protein